jgi:hypothetical protein
MARDKLITIRIEGEKRQAFGELAKSHNTDTASLLYDFISGCLSGRIDISLVTGKGNRLDKIDNQLDTNRLDKLETATQEIDNRLGIITKKLNDWVIAFDDRLNDCGRELSNKITSLEHRLNTLAIQLDSQQIDSIDSIDTDRQGETPDMGTVATVESAIETVEAVYTVESVDEPDSINEPVTGAIGPVPDETDSIDTEPGKGEIPTTHKAIAARLGIKSQTKLNYWISTGRIPSEYADKCRFNESKTKIVWII